MYLEDDLASSCQLKMFLTRDEREPSQKSPLRFELENLRVKLKGRTTLGKW